MPCSRRCCPSRPRQAARGVGHCARYWTGSSTCCAPVARGATCRTSFHHGAPCTAGSCACRRHGVCERLAHALTMADRERAGRDASPTGAILDAQAARSGGAGADLHEQPRRRRVDARVARPVAVPGALLSRPLRPRGSCRFGLHAVGNTPTPCPNPEVARDSLSHMASVRSGRAAASLSAAPRWDDRLPQRSQWQRGGDLPAGPRSG